MTQKMNSLEENFRHLDGKAGYTQALGQEAEVSSSLNSVVVWLGRDLTSLDLVFLTHKM